MESFLALSVELSGGKQRKRIWTWPHSSLLKTRDLLLQVEKFKFLGKKTNKGPVSEDELSIYSSSEAKEGIQEGAEGLGWFLGRRQSPPAAWAQTAKSPP